MSLKKWQKWWIIYVTGKKYCEKQPKIIKHFMPSENFIFFCVCIKWTHLLYLLQKHGEKNGVEVIEYGGEISINQGHLQKKLDIANIADRTQYYSSELKKMRWVCGK